MTNVAENTDLSEILATIKLLDYLTSEELRQIAEHCQLGLGNLHKALQLKTNGKKGAEARMFALNAIKGKCEMFLANYEAIKRAFEAMPSPYGSRAKNFRRRLKQPDRQKRVGRFDAFKYRRLVRLEDYQAMGN